MSRRTCLPARASPWLDGGDCYLGRPIVVFQSSVTNDATDQLGKFSLAHAEYHTFAFVIRASDKKVIELGYPRSITAQPKTPS